MSLLYTHTLECAGECGAKIELTGHHKRRDETDAVAELLGWSTVDKGKNVEIFCQECIMRAQRIVATVGPLPKPAIAVTNKKLETAFLQDHRRHS
jgi:hypothetical protein